MKKKLQLKNNLFLSVSCLSLSYTNLFQIGSNDMYCPRKENKKKDVPSREGGGGENPNSIFVGKYLIYFQSTLPISPGCSRSMSESTVHLLYLNCCYLHSATKIQYLVFCKGSWEWCVWFCPQGPFQGNQIFMKAVFSVFSFSFAAFLILIFF